MARRNTSVSIISSHVPRQCGIATFSNDLATNLAKHVHRSVLDEDEHISQLALNDTDEEYAYGPKVQFEIRQHHRSDYRKAADFLNTSRSEVISLQHEYGLFGGPDGNYILQLLERLNKPVVTTLHTVLGEPTAGQRDTLARIGEFSSGMVVMAQRAALLCQEVYGITADKIRLIHHGTPDVEAHNPDDFKARFQVKGRPVLLTFGLLGPGKGIENMLEALADVAKEHPDVAYLIVGATHPGVKRESGESYRLGLESRAVDLGIAKNVFFHNHYVTLPLLIEFLRAADIYVTPYRSKEQIVSGTLAFAVACGKAIVSTPFYYAQEMLADERGLLAEFDGGESLARHIRMLLDEPDTRRSMQEKAYQFGRQMVWSAVAKKYDALFREVYEDTTSRESVVVAEDTPPLRLSLPELRLDHLYRLTDDTGMLQHAIYSTPDRHHGYATDDNARALLVAAMSHHLLKDKDVLAAMECYLSFLHHAFNPQNCRFRNFMSYERKWLDEDGTEDCYGRAIWVLGYLTTHPADKQDLSLATELFHRAALSAGELVHPRAQALCIIGFHYYLRRFPDAGHIRELLNNMARSLLGRYKENASEDWRWINDELTYNNARIPQALILGGSVLEDSEMLRCGLECLRWMIAVLSTPQGHISLVGNQGWWQRGKPKPQFDQQAIDAVALVEACKSAFKASNNDEWLDHMWRCFEWFLGKNDAGVALADFKSRGCHDGLEPDGINRNQGAESTLSWLLALLTMYEMHPGEPPADGDRTA